MNNPRQNAPSLVSEAEWNARVNLAAAYRLVAHFAHVAHVGSYL
jgi:hypothetical protein